MVSRKVESRNLFWTQLSEETVRGDERGELARPTGNFAMSTPRLLLIAYFHNSASSPS